MSVLDVQRAIFRWKARAHICPLKYCPKPYRTHSGLEAHLYLHHRKYELIAALLSVLRL